jgi:CHAD domain-containing protein
MAYHLKSGEQVPDGIKRAAREELQFAADQLDGVFSAKRDEAIHEARKSIKKVRGILRLMRPELDGIYRTEAKRLGKIGRTLSKFRDAGAIIGTFDSLRDKYRAELGRRTLSSIRHGLVRRKEEAEHEADIDKVLRGMAKSLRNVEKRVKSWPLKRDGFPALAPGLEETYRRGQKAMALARKRGSAENFHTWRKRLKDHWYHVRLLERLWTDVMLAYEKSLKDAETWLGEDHNLAVLRDKFSAEPEFFGKRKEMDLVLDRIGNYQHELRANALSLGERIYEEKPRQFVQHMKHLWEAWQSQPKTLEAVQKLEREVQRTKKSGRAPTRRSKAANTAA